MLGGDRWAGPDRKWAWLDRKWAGLAGSADRKCEMAALKLVKMR